MAHARKIAITIAPDLLAEAERRREVTAESRSAFFARGLRLLLALEARERKVKEYVDAYRAHPETPEDLAWAEDAGLRSLAAVPWTDASPRKKRTRR
jgi:hypothetical protein